MVDLAERADLPFEETMLDGLAWDDEESTRESIRALRAVPTRSVPASVAPESAAPQTSPRRDTIVELDEGPCTDRAPSTQSSAIIDGSLTSWDDGDPTHPHARARVTSDIVGVESAAPESLHAPEGVPESVIRRSSDRHPKSTPLPLARELSTGEVGTVEMDDEDMRATVRREVVNLASGRSGEMTPPSLPSLRSLMPSQVVVDERLLGEVARLHRWLRFSLALGAMALVVSVVLAVLLASAPAGGSTLRLEAGFGVVAPALEADTSPPAPAMAPIERGLTATSDQPGVRMIVDGVERGTLPVTVKDLEPGMHEVRFEAGEAFGVDERRVMVPDEGVVDLGEVTLVRERVEVLIALQNPFASVAVTRFGGLPEPVSGPWPRTIYLPEGKYTLTAAQRGKKAKMIMLDLSLDKPKREIVLRIR